MSLCAGVLLSVFIVHCGAISEYLVLSVYLPVTLFRDINTDQYHSFLVTVHISSCGKVIFLQACVKNSFHGGGHVWQGVCMAGVGTCVAVGCAWQGGKRRRGESE